MSDGIPRKSQRSQGTNPRALGANPRASGTHPRGQGAGYHAATGEGQVITLWLECPNCGRNRKEWAYFGDYPKYFTCETCGRVIPALAWRCVAWGNLGDQPHIVGQRTYLGEFSRDGDKGV